MIDGVPVYGTLDKYGMVIVSEGAIDQAKRAVLASTARNAADQQLTCAALDALIPVAYGQPRLGGLLANAMVYNNSWVFWIIWCEGIIDTLATANVTMNDVALPASATAAHYKGDQTTYDSTLANAFAANGIGGFAEVCAGLAYSVISIPFADVTSVPNFNATPKGRKVYDPRGPTTTWSDNPALIAADYIVDAMTGAGLAVDWTSVGVCADFCDETVGVAPNTEKRRLSSMVVDRDATVDAWIETMRASGAFFVLNTQGTLKFVPDKDGAPEQTYSHADGDIMSIGNPTMRDATTMPTVIEVQYTDTSRVPWQTQSCDPVMRDGVADGSVPYRKSVVAMPWITRASQAKREAIERLNKLWLRSITTNLQLFDEGLLHAPGSIIAITYPEAGFSALPVRVTGAVATDAGWTFTIEKHDVGAYSDVVQNAPTTPTTNLPSPSAPPVVTGLDADEDVYQMQTGVFASRLIITWDDMRTAFPFLSLYWITVLHAGTVVHGPVGVQQNAQRYVTPALQEGLTYTVTIAIQSATGNIGSAEQVDYDNLGKLKLGLPSDVPSFSGIELGGEVRYSWAPATDYDLSGYELRYGLTSGTWDTALLVDRVATPGVTYTTRRIPAGTWRHYIKALDSVRSEAYPNGQESSNARYFDLEVHLDSGASVVASYDFTPTGLSLTNFVACQDGWVSNYGETWNAKFTSTINSYAQILASYSTGGTSVLLTESKDFGTSYSGQWIGEIDYADLSGTATVELGLSANGSSWSWYPLSYVGAARYARLRVTTTGVALVRSLGDAYCAVVVDIGAVKATADAALKPANNLSEVTPATARTNLGLGSAATQASTAFATATQGTTADNALPKAGGTMTGTLNLGNKDATAVKTVSFNGIIDDGTVSGGTYTVNFQSGQYHKMTMGAAVTAWSITAPSGPCVVQVEINQGASANYAMTMDASFKWPANYATADKALSAVNGARDLLVLRWNGTDYVANLIKGIA